MRNIQLPSINYQVQADRSPANAVAQMKVETLVSPRVPFSNPNDYNVQALNNQNYYPMVTQDKMLDQMANRFARCPH